MTDDLVKRLRDKHCCDATKCNCDEAADRIEQQDAEQKLLMEINERLMAALRNLLGRFDEYCEAALGQPVTEDAWEEVAIARAALAGEKKDDSQ